MVKMERCEAPTWLLENWKIWGKDWNKKYNDGMKWSWRVGKRKKQELDEKLLKCTKNHCAYCDNFPLGSRNIKPTIDHFRPKANFPLIAYQWENLFIACSYCQERGNKFDEALLKPDEADYDFDTYFEYENRSGKIVPNRLQTSENQERAKLTIQYFRLNTAEDSEEENENVDLNRKALYKKYIVEKNLDKMINILPYRYMFS